MPISFTKMHAHGDDFIVVDMRGKVDSITSEVAQRLGVNGYQYVRKSGGKGYLATSRICAPWG